MACPCKNQCATSSSCNCSYNKCVCTAGNCICKSTSMKNRPAAAPCSCEAKCTCSTN
ncbi:hypothetical protein ACQY0O_001933 [Thecaphora frezii]